MSNRAGLHMTTSSSRSSEGASLSRLDDVNSSSETSASAADAAFDFEQGDFHVTVVSDGYISVPGEIIAPDVTPEERRQVLGRLDTCEGVVHAPANIPVLRSKGDVILFDVGAGSGYQSSDGRLQQNLAASGVSEDSITKIVFTHAHPDHIAATLNSEGCLRCPSATYFVGAIEWNYWMDSDFFNKRQRRCTVSVEMRSVISARSKIGSFSSSRAKTSSLGYEL